MMLKVMLVDDKIAIVKGLKCIIRLLRWNTKIL